MCGIAGFVDPSGRVADPEEVLSRMTSAVTHRGPDAEGRWARDGAFLGHRRLKIIDLEGSVQPLANEDGDVVVVFNGEIYNFGDIRPGLAARGHTLRTQGDTEVLVHLYEDKGRHLLDDLVGMFAFAIWDAKRRRLLLARDRMGQKPLYYCVTPDGGIAFGSELRVLMEHPAVQRVVDPVALRKYLLFDYVPAPATILTGVHKLQSGEWLLWEDGRVQTGFYWDQVGLDPATLPKDERGIHELLWERLRESTRLRLIADVPLGVFLSGGIDSSTIVALMAELMPPDRIKTFSIGFENKSFDESSHAREVAQWFGTDHREEILSPQVMLDLLPDILGSMSEPLADGSLVPTYLLSRFTRRHVTVALGGDGGDELLLGYPTFQAHQAARALALLPRRLWRDAVRPLVRHLPVSTDNISFDFKVKRFVEGMGWPPVERHFVWIGSVAPDRQERLLSEPLRAATRGADLFADVARYLGRCAASDPFNRLSYVYSKLYMQDDILVKVDRATMAHGLEGRAPFLDHRVVELLAALPAHWKLRGLTMKYILKRMLKGKVPDRVIARPKKGFGMPVAEWLKGPLRPLAEDLLSEDSLRKDGFFEPHTVHGLLAEHAAGRADHRKALWSLLAFQLWLRRYGARRG
jgi:asparagine synthase (glutamine-hydrolysing)